MNQPRSKPAPDSTGAAPTTPPAKTIVPAAAPRPAANTQNPAVLAKSASRTPLMAPPPPPSDAVVPVPAAAAAADAPRDLGIRRFLQKFMRKREPEEVIREAIEELIEEPTVEGSGINADERTMLHNILALRDLTVADVMVPRIDIKGIPATTPLNELVAIMGKEAHSRLPVYNGSLDEAIGMVHIKDVLPYWNSGKRFNLSDVVRRVLFVAPTMKVLDMLLEMRRTHIHMALVVDEFGGIDGLLTIEDLVEEIVGEIDDEHDTQETATIKVLPDGTIEARARASIEEFERQFGNVFVEDERDNIDTLAGLVFSLAGRIPERGELIRHPSGIEFEVVDVDPRRIRRLRIRNLPPPPSEPRGK
jgi:CBS domain containing-hemolysin-like protein